MNTTEARARIEAQIRMHESFIRDLREQLSNIHYAEIWAEQESSRLASIGAACEISEGRTPAIDSEEK